MNRLQAIRAAIADFDALHGHGAAARDLALGLLAIGVILLDVAALAVVYGAPA